MIDLKQCAPTKGTFHCSTCESYKQFLAVIVKQGASAMKYIFRYLAYRLIALKQMYCHSVNFYAFYKNDD